ncbi:ATP-binding protein [Pseudophaeobacter flagellatus]|uniref:ATP-binding protein n=1 Tax=Pseudophaeobacter flagellatus TaxID=2899119 RepID=UPI001E4FD644|nr:ATP-binding protein [Pseudophaeobacter flagellatus]MCD9147862.1 ATP-binding protein [Pseudophaeobacter flagellatus]
MIKPAYEFPADVPTKPFFEEVTAVYGGRGSGKTTKAKGLIVEQKPPQVIWIDPTLPAATTYASLRADIEGGTRLIQVGAPDPEIAIKTLHIAFGLSSKERPLYVVCDEAATYLRSQNEMMMRIFNMGRHAGMGIMLLTQRPSGVHPNYREQSAKTFWGRLSGSNDISLAASLIGQKKAQTRRNAPVGDFLED